MESWCLSKHKSSLLIFLLLLISLVGWIQGIHIEDERKALLEIKASLQELSNFVDVDNLLPTWVDRGSAGGKHCDWERVKCDPISGYVTDLALSNIFDIEGMFWPLNVSPFLQFKELRRLDLSWNCIDDTFVSTGLERLSGLKKLENLNLSTNYIETDIIPLLSNLTSLKLLDLSKINGYAGCAPSHDVSEFRVSDNLEVLNLTCYGYYGSFPIKELSHLTKLEKLVLDSNVFNDTPSVQGCKSLMRLERLESVSLVDNYLNKSIISCLSFLPYLKVLDLSFSSKLGSSFPMQELSHLTKLEKLVLDVIGFNDTPSVQGCKSLMRLERLESVSLVDNEFNRSIISCLSFLPSLKVLDLKRSSQFGRFFPMQELSSLRELTTLDLSYMGLESLTFKGTMSNLIHLNLDDNKFLLFDAILRSMAAFPSLRYLSVHRSSYFEQTPFPNELPYLSNLEVLILSGNGLTGTLPIEALASFHHLEVLDLSENNFIGSIPSTIKLLSSLKAFSFSRNNINGSLPAELCELKNLHEMDISANNFDGKLPECFNKLSSLKFFDISTNQFTGKLLPSLFANLTSLEYVDFTGNKFEGSLLFSTFSNHTNLGYVSFVSDNDNFEVETEEPIGWTPMFQLKVLVLSNCNINSAKGSIVPRFLFHQHKLIKLDMSYNSLEGQFPNWLINNNTMLEVLILRDNSFADTFCMPFYRSLTMKWLDISGNHMIGPIPSDMQKFLPYITYLNLSGNSLDGVIPSSIGDISILKVVDLSHNDLSGEVPTGLLTNLSQLYVLNLSNNSLHGEVLSRNLILIDKGRLHLDNNYFTGNIRNMSTWSKLSFVDISNNMFSGLIPCSISNITISFESEDSLLFLDISQNNFSGSIPSCLNIQSLKHLHLGSNKFTGSIPSFFRKLTNVLTLDIGNNSLSSRIPKFLSELSSLRILLLGKNNFSGSIPRQLCRLTNMSLIDLSSNFLTGSIPRCLKDITGPSDQAFMNEKGLYDGVYYYILTYDYFGKKFELEFPEVAFKIQDTVLFTTKTNFLTYKGNNLDIMSGLDLSCNKLTGDIPKELGLLRQIHALNLSHNWLTGPIPVTFSNLVNIESLDLSSNNLTGKVPSELINLYRLEVFNVSFNNLSGRLPERKAQFGTFAKESYEGNPLLCGPPLDNTCTTGTHKTSQSNKEGNDEKWYDMDMTSFYGSSCSTWFVFMLGFATLLWVNPYWRRRWLDMVEECMYTCYYFLYDSVRKVSMHFFK